MCAVLDTSVLIGAESPAISKEPSAPPPWRSCTSGFSSPTTRKSAPGERSASASSRRRSDLAIAAAANVHQVALLTHNVKDFAGVADLVDVREP
jgi:predicted nucleic acid-binding protein